MLVGFCCRYYYWFITALFDFLLSTALCDVLRLFHVFFNRRPRFVVRIFDVFFVVDSKGLESVCRLASLPTC